MRKRLILNDIRKNRLFTAATVAFMTVSAMLFALTVLLSVSLLSSIQTLMEQAETPDFLQMHAGTVKEEEINAFAEAHPEVEDWQVMPFLNLENSKISLGEHSLADSTQDNGLSVQGQTFDYLVDLTNELPKVWPGEVFVPICYRAQYELTPGDIMQIGNRKFTIAGFIRDSQMNSMMASSKRFMVNEADYESMRKEGTEEYLIEFRLHEGTDTGVFENAYKEAGLPDNGPAVTKPLIRMMNALSDGMMIFVILLVSVVAVVISVICIRFLLLTRMEKERKEMGMLRAIGMAKGQIRGLWFAKYVALSAVGALFGLLLTGLAQKPLTAQMQELYGGMRVFDAGAGKSVSHVRFARVCDLYGDRGCRTPHGYPADGRYRGSDSADGRAACGRCRCRKVCGVKNEVVFHGSVGWQYVSTYGGRGRS